MAVNSFNAQNPPLTTKGDLFGFSTVPTRVAVGTDGQVLTADAASSAGVKWATAAASGEAWNLITSGTLSGGALNLTSLTTYDKYKVIIYKASCTTNDDSMRVRLNGGTSSNYQTVGGNYTAIGSSTTYAHQSNIAAFNNDAQFAFEISGCKSTTAYKNYSALGYASGAVQGVCVSSGVFSDTTAVTENTPLLTHTP